MMRNLMITLAYDGSAFPGGCFNPKAERTLCMMR